MRAGGAMQQPWEERAAAGSTRPMPSARVRFTVAPLGAER